MVPEAILMKWKKNGIILLGMLITLFTLTSNAIAMDWNRGGIGGDTDKKNRFGLREIYGEIIAISPELLILKTINGRLPVKITANTRLFCNGSECLWQALVPVTSDAFYEARVILSPENRLMAVYGSYSGAEFLVEDWRVENGNLRLNLVNVESNERLQRKLSKTATLPKQQWLRKGQVIFALFSYKGEIRSIFLPDE
jgi:hypothetical protein